MRKEVEFIQHTLKRHRLNYENAIKRCNDADKKNFYKGCIAGLDYGIGNIADALIEQDKKVEVEKCL